MNQREYIELIKNRKNLCPNMVLSMRTADGIAILSCLKLKDIYYKKPEYQGFLLPGANENCTIDDWDKCILNERNNRTI